MSCPGSGHKYVPPGIQNFTYDWTIVNSTIATLGLHWRLPPRSTGIFVT